MADKDSAFRKRVDGGTISWDGKSGKEWVWEGWVGMIKNPVLDLLTLRGL